jgi:putative spermidine/putrescine transport system substrate-binding protein
MDRRKFLIDAGLATATAALAPFGSRAFAQAKPSQMVLMTWGGLWGDTMRDSADAQFEKSTGVKIIQDRGSSPAERITKIKINLNDQKFDIIQIHDGLVPVAMNQGVLEPINRASPRLGNLKNVQSRFAQSHWVAMIYSPLGLVYNTKQVKTPPTSFADLWKPEFAGRIVLPDINHSIGPYIIPIGAMAAGKAPSDTEAGFEMLKKLVDQKPIWAQDTDSMMNSMRNEEAVIGLLYKSQTFTVQGWNTPVEWIFPTEGAILYSSGTGIAKGTKNLELAEQYLNLTLDPQVQALVAQKFNYPGTNTETMALLPPALQDRVRSTPKEMSKLVDLDFAMMAEKRPEWTDRWNRIVAAG